MNNIGAFRFRNQERMPPTCPFSGSPAVTPVFLTGHSQTNTLLARTMITARSSKLGPQSHEALAERDRALPTDRTHEGHRLKRHIHDHLDTFRTLYDACTTANIHNRRASTIEDNAAHRIYRQTTEQLPRTSGVGFEFPFCAFASTDRGNEYFCRFRSLRRVQCYSAFVGVRSSVSMVLAQVRIWPYMRFLSSLSRFSCFGCLVSPAWSK